MHSDFKGFVAISLSMLLTRVATLVGIDDWLGSGWRVVLLVQSLCWLAYGLWHVFGANKER